MNTRRITVTEAARNFADLVNRTHDLGETTLLTRSGEPVAMVSPVGRDSVAGRDWIARWQSMPHLDPADAEVFAGEVEDARNTLKSAASPWD